MISRYRPVSVAHLVPLMGAARRLQTADTVGEILIYPPSIDPAGLVNMRIVLTTSQVVLGHN